MSLPPAIPRRLRVVEVGPRDGLQNERATLPVEAKVAFITRLAAARIPVIEAGAFVRPDRVPQMADTDEVVRRGYPLPSRYLRAGPVRVTEISCGRGRGARALRPMDGRA